MDNQDCPLILTLQLDSASFELLNALRQRHFPVERNVIPAHLTLFHALPASEEMAIRRILLRAARETPAFPLLLASPFLLGKGVAIRIDSEDLLHLRAELARCFSQWLIPQDRQGFRPHVTIQNKVSPDAARRLYQQLQAAWHPSYGSGTGLLLWRYLGGPWQAVDAFSFKENLPDIT